jgi:hypothetical protein
VKTAAFLLALLFQTQPAAPLVNVRNTLRQLKSQFETHQTTLGAATELTTAKHQLRDWIDSRIAGEKETLDVGAFAETLQNAFRDADLFCDDCNLNYLGFADNVRVDRRGRFLVVITALGISCGYDESAYVYAWNGQRWERIWEHEQNTYTKEGYLPQQVHDIQISAADATGNRLLMLLGSQTVCAGSFKDLYARGWRMDTKNQMQLVLTWTGNGNDGYPPLLGRAFPDGVLLEFTAGGFIDGEPHTAVRNFKVQGDTSTRIDPIAFRPHDFVLEWLAAPWNESRTRSESASLEAAHIQLGRPEGVGDFPDPTLRCTAGPDLWQVATNLFEKPKRYFRVRWRNPFNFSMVEISEKPFPDCTVPDSRSETFPSLLNDDIH